MNNVYLDILFLTNFIADYIMLLCTAKVSNSIIRRNFIVVAALLGATYACICLVFPEEWFNNSFIRIISGIFLCLIVFYNEPHLIRCCITFIIISSIFGGILAPFAFYTENSRYITINPKAVFITFAVVYFILSYVYRGIGIHSTQTFQQAKIRFLNNEISITVLQDTGNELYDPISNLPVLIIERADFLSLINELSLYDSIEDIYDLFCELNSINQLSGKLRLIPCQSISGKDVLLGVVPDQILLNGKPKEMIIAFTNYTLSENNQYRGIC